MHRLVIATLAAVVLCTGSRAARACGQPAPAYWTLTGAAPSDDRDPIPTDGVILLSGKAWAEVHIGASELASIADIVVRDAAGAVVPGVVEVWPPSTVPTLAWRPRAPLAARGLFTLDAGVSPLAPRPPAAVGDASLSTVFATGPDPAPALRLTGGLQVNLETYDLELLKICNNCGGTGCGSNGTVRALRARVRIPSFSGGYTPDGYGAWLWISNDQPHELPDGQGGTFLNLGAMVPALPDGTTEVLLSVPVEDSPYAPCFSARVFDPSGHFVDAPPLCLARQDVMATIRDLDKGPTSGGGGGAGGLDGAVGAGGTGTPGGARQGSGADAAAAGGGCAVASTGSPGPSPLVLFLAFAFWMFLARSPRLAFTRS
jgi:hypothetical protein